MTREAENGPKTPMREEGQEDSFDLFPLEHGPTEAPPMFSSVFGEAAGQRTRRLGDYVRAGLSFLRLPARRVAATEATEAPSTTGRSVARERLYREMPPRDPAFARHIDELDPELARDIDELDPELARDIDELDPELARDIDELGPELARDIDELDPPLAQSHDVGSGSLFAEDEPGSLIDDEAAADRARPGSSPVASARLSQEMPPLA